MKSAYLNDVIQRLRNIYIVISKRGIFWFLKRQVLKIYFYVFDLIDSIPYSAKKRAQKKFDKYIREEKLFFTASINKHGLTDQLFSLTFLYTIGRQLGLNYYFNPPHTLRSEPYIYESDLSGKFTADTLNLHQNPFNVYDFIGVNEYFKKLSVEKPEGEFNEILIDLDELAFGIRAFQTFGHFLDALRIIMVHQIDSSKKEPVYF